MRNRIFNCAMIGMLIAVAALPAANPQIAFAQEAVYQENFEDGQAQGWELEPGWQVVSDGGNQVLRGQGHSWARSNQSFDIDYTLSFRLKLLKGAIHLIVRMNNAGRYFIGFEADGSYLNKQYWPEEFHNDLAREQTSHNLNTWYQIEIVMQGSTLALYVNSSRVWTYTDPEPLTGGSFAFETLDGSQAMVDDILVEHEGANNSAPTIKPQPSPSVSLSQLAWIRTGGPLGGLGYDIRMRPDDPDIMFATDAYAGVHKSTDGGATWFPSNNGITGRQGNSGDDIPVFCLTIDPNNDGIVWAGMQWLGQLYRSGDNGKTWAKRSAGIVEGEGLTFRGITIEPGNSNVVYAAAEISPEKWAGHRMKGLGFDMTKGVLYKSTNGGQYWTAIWRGDNLARYIWIDPTNVNILYLSTGIFDREAANSDPGSRSPGGVGIIKTTDGGKTWTQINNGLNNLYVGSLFMHPTNPNILLAGVGNNIYREGSGVYLTSDGGAQWQLVLDTAPDAVTSVEFSTRDPRIAYAGGQNIFAISSDGGLTWQKRENSSGRWGPPGIAPGFPIDFQVDPRDSKRIFTNNYGGGNFLSEDGGLTWTSSSTGYTGADLRSLSVDPRYSGLVYVNGRSGPFVSQDGGMHWQGINSEELAPIIEGSQIIVASDNPMHLLMTESNGTPDYAGRILWSDDGGKTWQNSTTDWSNLRQTENTIIGGVEALAFAPSQPSRVYAVFGNNGCKGFGLGCESPQLASTIAISDDGGRSWTHRSSLPHDNMPGTALVVHPDDPDHAWVAVPNFGIYETKDGGTGWLSASNGLGKAQVRSLAIDTSNGDVLYAGTLDQGVFKSIDGSATWKKNSAGMDANEPIFTIAINSSNPNNIYAGSMRSGVFRSEDGGKTWRKLNNGLIMRTVHDLVFSADGDTLYATTHGGGVFRLDLTGAPPQPAPNPTSTPVPTSPSLPAAEPAQPVVEPTATSAQSSPLIKLPCGSALIPPVALLGLVWFFIRKRSMRR